MSRHVSSLAPETTALARSRSAPCPLVRGATLRLLLALLVLPFLLPTIVEARPDDSVVVVLHDGTELVGVLVREDDSSIAIRSAFGVTTIERSKVKEIRRGENPWRSEFDTRFDRARRLKKATTFAELGRWAGEKGLGEESVRAYEEAIALDPHLEEARVALGHARFEGQWVDAERVDELIAEGYEVRGVDLVKGTGSGTSANGGSSGRGVSEKEKPTGGTSKPEVSRLTPEEQERRERLLEKRRKERQKFEEERRREFEGVPWASRHKIKSRNYDLHCNSTRDVAEAYSSILEALYGELRKRFNQRHLRKGRLPVFIYRNQQEFMNRTGAGPGTGGFYRTDGTEQVHAFYGPFGMTQTTYNVLAHEATHQFQGRVLPDMRNLNNWIIEGFAVYFGDGSRIDYKKKKIVTGIIPRDRLMNIQDRMREGTNQPLSRLAGLPRNRFGGAEYADSWSLLYFLINGPESKKGQELIAKYWLAGCERRVGQREFNQLAEHYFGSVGELEEQWKKFILNLVPEPAGEIDDDGVFTSLDYMFEIIPPVAGWSVSPSGKRASQLVHMTPDDVEGDNHHIVVSLVSKPDELQSAESYIADTLVPWLERTYTDVTHEQVTLNEYHPFVLEFVEKGPEEADEDADEAEGGEEPEPEDGTGKIPPAGEEEAGGDEAEAEPVVRKRYRAYVIVGVSNAYFIECAFPIEEFDEYVPVFEGVAQSFAKIFRNRW